MPCISSARPTRSANSASSLVMVVGISLFAGRISLIPSGGRFAILGRHARERQERFTTVLGWRGTDRGPSDDAYLRAQRHARPLPRPARVDGDHLHHVSGGEVAWDKIGWGASQGRRFRTASEISRIVSSSLTFERSTISFSARSLSPTSYSDLTCRIRSPSSWGSCLIAATKS